MKKSDREGLKLTAWKTLLQKEKTALKIRFKKVTDKEFELNKKYDELLDKEDYLADLVAKQLSELERVSGMSRDEAKKYAFGAN